jgi:predicted dehydrogenase
MLDAVEQAGVIHMIAFNYRRTPAVALARRYIEDGRIGKILEFRVSHLQDWSADPKSPRTWRHQKAIAGSGTLGDIGTHAIDMARYLVGEITAVNAMVKNYVPFRPLGNESDLCGPVDVDNGVVTLAKFECGCIGSIEATRNAHGRNNYLSFELHGSKGSLSFNYERRDELQVMFSNDPIDAREALVERSEERWWCAELYRLRGVFLTAIDGERGANRRFVSRGHQNRTGVEVSFPRKTRRKLLRRISSAESELAKRTSNSITSLVTLKKPRRLA